MLLIYASLSNSQLTQGSLGIKVLDLNSVKATLPTAVTLAAAPLTAARSFGSSVYITKTKQCSWVLALHSTQIYNYYENGVKMVNKNSTHCSVGQFSSVFL